MQKYAPRERIELEFRKLKIWAGGEEIDATARVATCYPQVGNGIKFLEMAREDQWKLAHFIAQLENR